EGWGSSPNESARSRIGICAMMLFSSESASAGVTSIWRARASSAISSRLGGLTVIALPPQDRVGPALEPFEDLIAEILVVLHAARSRRVWIAPLKRAKLQITTEVES